MKNPAAPATAMTFCCLGVGYPRGLSGTAATIKAGLRVWHFGQWGVAALYLLPHFRQFIHACTNRVIDGIPLYKEADSAW